MMDDRVHWIRLQQALGYGTARLDQLLNQFDNSAAAVCAAGPEELRARGLLTAKQAEALRAASPEQALKILERCQALGCRVLTPPDPGYPALLREIYSRPLVLYVLGGLDCLEVQLPIGIVGTRHNSEYGRRAADLLGRELARCGAVVVSGMAAGIDTFAHTGALKGGGKTVAVLGCGVDTAYPPQNRTLMDLIALHGAVVSEYPPGTQPVGSNFPIRNRIISGLCRGVVVVEGQRRSGSLITAGHALAQGRDVFAVPGSIFESGSAGPHWLISQGAIPVTCTRDILEEYLSIYPDTIDTASMEQLASPRGAEPPRAPQPERPAAPRPAPAPAKPAAAPPQKPPAPLYLGDLQRRLYELMESTPQPVDALTARLGAPVSQVLSALTQLEVYGLVEALPGHCYIYAKEK